MNIIELTSNTALILFNTQFGNFRIAIPDTKSSNVRYDLSGLLEQTWVFSKNVESGFGGEIWKSRNSVMCNLFIYVVILNVMFGSLTTNPFHALVLLRKI